MLLFMQGNIILDFFPSYDYIAPYTYIGYKEDGTRIRFENEVDDLIEVFVNDLPSDIEPMKYKYENGNFSLNTEEQYLITKADFLERLTEQELFDLVNYEDFINSNNNIVEDVKKQQIKAMKTVWTKFNNIIEIDLNRSEMLSDFAQIVAWVGCMTTERIEEVIIPGTILW